MREVFDNLMKSVYTAMPATVLKVYDDGMFVDVMPVIDENNGRINNVMLVFPQSKKYGFRFRVEEKDEVLLITSKYPLDNLYTRKEESRVNAGRGKLFQYGECFALPNISQFSSPLKKGVQCEIAGEKANISFTDDDGLKIDADCPIEINSKDKIDITATSKVNIEGTEEVNINGAQKVSIESAVKVDVKAININLTGAVNITGPLAVNGIPTIGTGAM